ncbi:murein biosynthesis integral membrane protein MurJ [Colwellia psychrerythraea]|uniref:Probable lipid II flippase MurJ n=1 Tax=Colwellia psychrerythraea (strain 34H / ATCC BAA-681) TaxID=167879 RepID=Q486U2_COLP3|nr:murein biosynthesis integral membrane protein MurJ [Colwellia psychrerythraea]AAZ26234.1 integral membrane protein MviN [Colwellia psychrerythraea 34H]
MSKKLIKSGMIVSVMTLISRVLGLIRDVVIANVMGAGVMADVFLFANKIPNFFRRLFAEGAFAQAFVPVLSEYQVKDEQQAEQNDKQNAHEQTRLLIAQASGTLGIIITGVTLFGMLASPLFVMLFGFGWFIDWLNDAPGGEKFDLASNLLSITFPYLWFISFAALTGAVLNTLGRFAVAAFTPVLLNIAIIGMAIFGSPYAESPAHALAWGVFLGGLIQFLFQIPFMYKAGMLVKPKWAWHSEGVTKIRKLIVPALFGVSVTQINLLLDTVIASFLITGSISWLYYADRLLEFPLGLFGIGIATVILPSLSKLHSKNSPEEFSATLDWGIRVICLFGWPALAGLMVLAQPIIMVLFMRGEFDQQTVLQVSMALFAYLSGLLSFMFIKILAPGYYARQDTKTPVKIGIIAMVANMIFNLMLAPFIGYVGLALATSLSATLNAWLLYRGLKAQGVYQLSAKTLIFIAKLVLSAGVMALVVYQLSSSFDVWLTMKFLEQVEQLTLCIVAGVASYLVMIILLGVRFSDFKVIKR